MEISLIRRSTERGHVDRCLPRESRASRRRTQVVTDDFLGDRPSVRVTDTHPTRSSAMSPLSAHSGTKRIPGLRVGAR